MLPAILLVAAVVGASPVPLHIHRHGKLATGAGTVILSRFTATSDPDQPASERRQEIDPGKETATIDVEAGQWSLEMEGEGIWHRRQYFDPATTRELDVDLWPALAVTGRLETEDGTVAPRLVARFLVPESADGTEIDCAIKKAQVKASREARFRCSVPAGTNLLNLRIPGFISHHVPIRTTQPGTAVDLGVIHFKRGQSIVGTIELGPSIRAQLVRASVIATPRGASASSSISVAAGSDGSFHIDGVTPGEYVVAATHPDGLSSESAVVTVRKGADSELIRPLILDHPRRLVVAITPATTPTEEAWRVRMSRLVGDHFVEPVSEGKTGADGTWSAPPQQPAHYEIEVTTSDGAIWAREEVRLESGETTLSLTIEAEPVKGRVYLGDVPLRAHLDWTSPDAEESGTESDEEGRFDILLPKAQSGEWRVHVKTDNPSIDYTFPHMSPPPDGTEMDLRIPNLLLSGMVVDEKGEPAPSFVDITSPQDGSQFVQIDTAEDGTFLLRGVAAGKYSLQAEIGGEQSDQVTVSISPEDIPTEIRLVLHADRPVEGQVVSPVGPVAGARVTIVPTDKAVPYVSTHTTDAAGRFFTTVPPGTSELDVRAAAPGFAYTIGHVRYENRVLQVSVSQQGGELRIVTGKGERFRLKHAGAIVDIDQIRNSWMTADQPDGSIRIDEMEPGLYSLCNETRCVDGFLAPFGSVRLELAEPTTSADRP